MDRREMFGGLIGALGAGVGGVCGARRQGRGTPVRTR